MDAPAAIGVGVIALAASCCTAHRAGGGGSAWVWGLLGPVGWLLAALTAFRTVLGGLRQMTENTTPGDEP